MKGYQKLCEFIKYGNNRLDGLGKPPENLVRSSGPLKLKNNNLLVNKPIYAVTEFKFRASGGYQSNQGAWDKFFEMTQNWTHIDNENKNYGLMCAY